MSQYNESGVKTFTASGAIAKDLRVVLDATSELILADASAIEFGTAVRPAFAQGDPTPVRLRTAQGTTKVIAMDAIAVGATVFAAAAGKASVAGTVTIGEAIEASAADGDVIEILRV